MQAVRVVLRTDRAGERAAAFYALIGSATLNGLDPEPPLFAQHGFGHFSFSSRKALELIGWGNEFRHACLSCSRKAQKHYGIWSGIRRMREVRRRGAGREGRRIRGRQEPLDRDEKPDVASGKPRGIILPQ